MRGRTAQEVSHLDVLPRVLQKVEKRIFTPCHPALLYGATVPVTVGHTRLTAKESVQVQALLVCAAGIDGVALGAFFLGADLGEPFFSFPSSFAMVVISLGSCWRFVPSNFLTSAALLHH